MALRVWGDGIACLGGVIALFPLLHSLGGTELGEPWGHTRVDWGFLVRGGGGQQALVLLQLF